MSAKKRTRKPTIKDAMKSMGGAPQRKAVRIGRNEPCPCGSGSKYKDCHSSQGETYLQTLVAERERELLKEKKAQLKQMGVPWYKRLFLRE